MLKHYDIRVTGKVQGVWYRKSTSEKANELGIKGTVRNLPNNAVYIEAEGEEDRLNLFLNWCADGPELAEVSSISSKEGSLSNYNFFEILY